MKEALTYLFGKICFTANLEYLIYNVCWTHNPQQGLGCSPKKHIVGLVFPSFLFFLFFSSKKMKKAYFDHRNKCAAPKRWFTPPQKIFLHKFLSDPRIVNLVLKQSWTLFTYLVKFLWCHLYRPGSCKSEQMQLSFNYAFGLTEMSNFNMWLFLYFWNNFQV